MKKAIIDFKEKEKFRSLSTLLQRTQYHTSRDEPRSLERVFESYLRVSDSSFGPSVVRTSIWTSILFGFCKLNSLRTDLPESRIAKEH